MIKKANLFKKLKNTLANRYTNLRSVKKDENGVALIEFAIAAPMITVLLVGCIDLAVYLAAHQRISRSAYTMSNLLTQMDQGLTERQVQDMMLALDQVSRPFNIGDDGVATITAIIGEGVDGAAPNTYSVAWKRCYGPNTSGSEFGAEDSTVSSGAIPANTITTTGQILVVTEIEYEFTPILGFLPLAGEITYDAFFRPRRGTIENIVADGTAPAVCS